MGFIRSFSIAMGANIIVFVISFITNKIIYLYLSKTDNGIFFLVMRSSLFLALFFGDWLRLSCMNIAGRDKKSIPFLSANGLWYSVTVCLVLLLPAVLFSSVSNTSILGVPSQYLFVIVIVGAAFIARNNWQSLLIVNHHMFSYGFVFVLWAGLFLLVNIFFLVIFNYGLVSVVIAFVVATIVSTIWAFISSLITNGHTFRPSWALFRMSGKIGMRSWIAVLGMFLMLNVHTFAIEPLAATPEEGLVMVAVFSICFRVFLLFQRGSDVAGTVLYSHIVQQDRKASSKMVMLASRNIILVSIVFAFICALAGKSLIALISSTSYTVAYYPLLIMLPGILALNTGGVINSYYWGNNYPLRIITVPYIAALIGLCLNIFLIPRIGVSGATLSFSIMSILWLIYQSISFSKDSNLHIGEILIPRLSDIKHLLSNINRTIHRRKQ